MKRVATSPSTTRWSKEAPSVVTNANAHLAVDDPRLLLDRAEGDDATSPGLRIGVPVSMPKTPMLVIVTVPFCHLGGLGLAVAGGES